MSPSPRPFHFLSVVRSTEGLSITVRGFDESERALRDIDRFDLIAP